MLPPPKCPKFQKLLPGSTLRIGMLSIYVLMVFSVHSSFHTCQSAAQLGSCLCTACDVMEYLLLFGSLPQCKVLLTLPIPISPWLPRDSMMSISPDLSQPPYLLLFGNIQIAGQIQSPVGILALTSITPYFMVGTDFTLPDITGGRMPYLPSLEQPYWALWVHTPNNCVMSIFP